MSRHRAVCRRASALCGALLLVGASAAAAAPEGMLTFALHFSPVPRWLDPAEGESTITPYLILYAIHDGLLKPMPGSASAASLAASWSMAKDGLSADFTLRPGIKFHNGEPVTSDDVKFSFERFRGGAARILKDTVKEIQTPAPNRVRFVFKEPWPDFPAFYGTFVASAGWVVPRKYVERVGEEGFRKAPVGAGPYKFVSFNPGVELHGVVLTISDVSGNAATRLESFVTKSGAFAFGSLPEVDDLFCRQGKELDRKKREASLFQIQRILQEQVTQVPVYHLGFPTGLGPRVEDIVATPIPGFYMSPYEDLKLKKP
jgi:ABC-type transport system substrate-binding protein